jgi:methyl-accepting chemotaxis protein
MVKMFKDLHFGLKIGLSFSIVLVLLSLVLGVVFFALKKADEGVTTYRGLARDTNLSGRLRANMLMVRMRVLSDLNTQSDSDLAQYKDRLAKMHIFLVGAKKETQQPECAELITACALLFSLTAITLVGSQRVY